MNFRWLTVSQLGLILLAFVCWACSARPSPQRPTLLVSTVQLLEMVQAVARPEFEVELLVPRASDPHLFEPSPQDLQKIRQCRLVVAVGAGLEGWAEHLLERRSLLELSAHLPVQRRGPRQELDPHLWSDPQLMVAMTRTLVAGLESLSPGQREQFRDRGEAYIAQLQALDYWAQEQLRPIPVARRFLVTSHDALGYFADRYRLVVVGSLLPSVTTESLEPSPLQLQQLLLAMRRNRYPAIFCDSQQNHRHFEAFAQQAGVKLVPDLWLDTLGPEGGPADTYQKAMRWNVVRIAQALQ